MTRGQVVLIGCVASSRCLFNPDHPVGEGARPLNVTLQPPNSQPEPEPGVLGVLLLGVLGVLLLGVLGVHGVYWTVYPSG